MTPPIWATKHYVWATVFQFLGAQVATKELKSVCSNELNYSKVCVLRNGGGNWSNFSNLIISQASDLIINSDSIFIS